MRNVFSITDYQDKKDSGECFWDPGQAFQMPTEHNGTSATQCDICCSGLCNFAQHYIDMLQGRPPRTRRQGQ